MVAAHALIALLAVFAPGAEPDSAASPIDAAHLEDALLEGELDESDLESGIGAATALAFGGMARAAAGSASARFAAARGPHRADLLVARERGEPRGIDDVYLRLSSTPLYGTEFALGWIAPRAGSGLALGPRRTPAERPFEGRAAPARLALDALSVSPASTAAGVRGAWLRHTRDAWSLALLAADTPRDARPSGDAWWPVASVRHRTPLERARRGALRERLAAAAVTARLPFVGLPSGSSAWLVFARAASAPRRETPVAPGTAAEAASGTTRGGNGGEAGLALGRAACAAFALDARGRLRTRAWWHMEARDSTAETSATIAWATEASGFTPLLARAENLPRSHLAARFRTRWGRTRRAPTLALEAYAIERGPEQRARFGIAVLVRRGDGLELALARDADPARTLVAVRRPAPSLAPGRARAALGGGAEWRFDRRGLARETWRIEARARGPGGAWGELETQLSSGRSGYAFVDLDAPGGLFTRRARGASRTRLTIGSPGVVAPRATVIWLGGGGGGSVEWRFALQWGAR